MNSSSASFLTTQRLSARLVRLVAGLLLYGVAMALMIRGNIGASPWDVFAQGVSRTTQISFGMCTIIISGVVLLLWIPLKQRPGVGTIANALLVGAFADVGLFLIPEAHHWALQVLTFSSGLCLIAFATALYIGAGLGPGPRDGLMTGLVRVSGKPVWLIRTGLEFSVVVIGFLLGGVVGAGTAAFALGVGPLTQVTLRWLHVDLHAKTPRSAVTAAAPAPAPDIAPAPAPDIASETDPAPASESASLHSRERERDVRRQQGAEPEPLPAD